MSDQIYWRALADEMPEPECFVLTWDGKKVGIDWWGSIRYRRDDNTTHWCPFPTPPEAGSMYGLHSVKFGYL